MSVNGCAFLVRKQSTGLLVVAYRSAQVPPRARTSARHHALSVGRTPGPV